MRINCVLAVGMLGLIGSIAADDKPAPMAAPPLEIQVEVNGKSMTAQTGVPFEVEVAGQKVQMRVTTLPYRIFNYRGIKFRYPANHAWEVDNSDASYITWTLDGNSNVLTITRYAVEVGLDDVTKTLVNELTQQYGGRDNVRVSPVSMQLGPMSVKGQRLDVTLINQHLRQDIYAFKAAGATFSMVIQDMPENDKTTAETQETVELLEKTFEITEK
jgi:hypothetical protein